MSMLHPSSPKFKYVVLFVNCMLTFGSYFCFDMPSTMKEQLQKAYIEPWAPKHGAFQQDFFYQLFYSVYAWTNALIGCLFGGIIVDKYGKRKSTVLFSFFYLFGQVLFASGASLHFLGPQYQYMVMFAGRFFFGIGGGSITLVQNTISATYFMDGGLATAFGFTLTASRVGSVLNLLFTSEIVDATSVPCALWIGVGMCLVGCGFGLIFICLDRRYEQWLEENATDGNRPMIKKVNFTDIAQLPARLWVIGLVISTYYICIFAFVAIAKSFFQAKWAGDESIAGPEFWQANLRASTVYFMSMIFTIFVGAFVDRIGRRAQLAVVTCLLSIPSFLLFQYTDLDPIFGMLLLGVTYMMAASTLWPGIPLVVPKHLLGTANGMATLIQMVGIAIANMYVGTLQDKDKEFYPGTHVHKYDYCLTFFMVMGVVAAILAVLLNILDARAGGQLNATPANRENQQGLLKGRA